ncbi:GNAT family N-acetyltransferase [Streptomyces sp. HP-A2021]|uniref:GNAT family N-acetyltransferase n=1 Tax=Streptomyces sp. HP-A2021 TaxID=2927875 RepID=UPI001FB0320D|nr:GNAT family N-acetyltransferase [Streptomyces sp. HP-A2021]UOB12824.1 GNAT family N-acetyltransferase [Streptomyces sp. HP-A2021]
MTERTTYLDSGTHPSRSRRINVRAHQWYATVEVDRDNFVDAATALGQDPELPSAYREALDFVRNVFHDRIWYDGYPGGFSWGGGSRWVTLSVPFSQVEDTVEALRAAELDHDYDKLRTLADGLVLPLAEWLAPGERELVRGVDFHSPPQAFLKFLRGKANESGLRLNGRATAGSIWVRPTVSPVQKLIRERYPEQYPGWVDRWTGFMDSEDAPVRPWVGSRGQDLSRGAKPVEFRTVDIAIGKDDCPCGMRLADQREDGKAHTAHHAAWAFGIRVPKSLMWLDDLAVVTPQSPISWRRLASRVGRMPQRENHYDFNSWSYHGEPQETPNNDRAFLLNANGYIIGYLVATDTSEHHRWDLVNGSRFTEDDETLRPRIDLIWTAGSYRGRGIGSTLVEALADDFGCGVGDVSWSGPISDAGCRLARRLSPDGIWVS